MIAILGDGAWGTALAMVLDGKGLPVTIWGAFPEYVEQVRASRENARFLPGVRIPDRIGHTADIAEALRDADWVVAAAPTQFMRSVFDRAKPHLRKGTPVVSVSKGIEKKTMLRNTQVIREILGSVPVAVLSGPSHAEEVARGLPCSVVAATPDPRLRKKVQALFLAKRFRVYASADLAGVELGGALKNVIALAAGICDGLELGDNAKSALITRGVVEISRLGQAMGGRAKTFFGLSCLGDLITTCASKHSRNRHVGEELGKGRKIGEILGSMQQVAEGVPTAETVHLLAKRHRVETPISRQVYRIINEGLDPRQAVADLMERAAQTE